MNLRQLQRLEPGHPVMWQDDETGDIVHGTVQEILTESESVEDADSVLVCVSLDGAPYELYAGELI